MSYSSLEFGLGVLSGGLGGWALSFVTSKCASRFAGVTAPVLSKLGAGILCGRIAYFVANDSPFWQGAASGSSLVDLGLTFFSATEVGSGMARNHAAADLHYNADAPAFNTTYSTTLYKWTIPALLAGKCFSAMTDTVPFAGRIAQSIAGAALSAYATEVAIQATQFIPQKLVTT